jgi:hypothetical protein
MIIVRATSLRIGRRMMTEPHRSTRDPRSRRAPLEPAVRQQDLHRSNTVTRQLVRSVSIFLLF